MHVKHTVRDLRVRVSVRVRNDFSNLTLTLIKPRTPRHKFANLSIVLVLSEAEPSGPRPRPRINAYFAAYVRLKADYVPAREYDHGNTLAPAAPIPRGTRDSPGASSLLRALRLPSVALGA